MIRETFEGEAFQRRKLRRLRIGVALASVLLAAPALPNSQDAAVVQVRVGKHPTYTRVVFELDEAADYTIRPSADDREIVVDLGAASRARVMTSRSDLVETVSVQPAEGGAVARIRLHEGPVHVTEMLLSGPPRIVLDLRRERVETAAAEPAVPMGGDSEPGDIAAPDATTPSADPWDEPPLAGGPAVSAGATEPADAGEPSATQTGDEPALAAEAGEPDLDPWDEPDLDPWDEPDLAEDGAPGSGSELAGTDPAATGSEPAPGLDGLLDDAADDPLTASTGEPDALPADTSEPATGATPESGLLSGPLGDPRVLLGLAGALVIAVLVAAWSRSRRRDKRSGLFSTAVPHLPDDEPVVEARPEEFEDQTLPRIAQAEPDLPEDRSLFDSSVGIEEAPVDDEKPEDAHVDAGGGVAPGVAIPGPTSGSSEKLERRIAGLERRLEEVIDAKDRLERHVAAQTEELRVQRAAIARTQRVLRNLTRPDDAPTEPALKTQE